MSALPARNRTAHECRAGGILYAVCRVVDFRLRWLHVKPATYGEVTERAEWVRWVHDTVWTSGDYGQVRDAARAVSGLVVRVDQEPAPVRRLNGRP